MRTFVPLFLLLALPAGTSATAQVAVAPAATQLTLIVSADVTRPPDTVRLAAGVVTSGASAAEALAANAARMNQVLAAVKAAGVADSDVQTSGLNVSPQYRYVANQPPQLTGYQVRNQVSLTSRKLADAGRLVDALVKAGANEVQGPEFRLSAAEAALDKARRAAIAKGRARAALYAEAAGLRLRRITSISEAVEGPEPVVRPMMRMAAAEAAPPTPMQPGELTLSVQVTMGFELEP